MHRRFCILFLCFLAIFSAQAEDAATAGKAYQKGNYQAAIQDYEKQVASGAYTPEVYYNLAAAYQMAGKPVDAVLNYRRALMLDPRMLQARRNLEVIQRSSGIPMPRFTWREEISSIVSPDWLMYGGTIAGWTGALLVVIGFLKKKPRFWWITFSIILLTLGKAIAVVGYMTDPKIADAASAVITAAKPVTARVAPADSSASVTKLVPGAGVNVLSNRGTWSYCQLLDGSTAWLPSQDLTMVVPTPSQDG